MPKVSVIVPVYNVEKFLARCLNSLISQTLKDIEIICINDGSTDKSLKILKEYEKKDNRIVVINQENQGVGCARNNGISVAKGEFIGFVDSDDFIDSDFYEKMYEAAVRTKAEIACTNIIRESRYKKRNIIYYTNEKIVEGTKQICLLAKFPKCCYIMNKIYKKELILNSKILFSEIMNFEDCIFTPQILELAKKIVTVPNTIYHYWKNEKSIVKTPNDKNRADFIEARKFMEEFCKKYNLDFYSSKKYLWKKEYFVFGIKVLKICRLRATTKYLLFGFLPILICEEGA